MEELWPQRDQGAVGFTVQHPHSISNRANRKQLHLEQSNLKLSLQINTLDAIAKTQPLHLRLFLMSKSADSNKSGCCQAPGLDQPKRQKSPQEDLNCSRDGANSSASTGFGAIYHQQGPERDEVTCEARAAVAVMGMCNIPFQDPTQRLSLAGRAWEGLSSSSVWARHQTPQIPIQASHLMHFEPVQTIICSLCSAPSS